MTTRPTPIGPAAAGTGPHSPDTHQPDPVFLDFSGPHDDGWSSRTSTVHGGEPAGQPVSLISHLLTCSLPSSHLDSREPASPDRRATSASTTTRTLFGLFTIRRKWRLPYQSHRDGWGDGGKRVEKRGLVSVSPPSPTCTSSMAIAIDFRESVGWDWDWDWNWD
jgi:hypothetical protein